VSGYRVRRRDGFLLRRLPSQVANGLIRLLTGVPVRDTGCALKAYRRDLVDQIFLYSDLHRFIPAVAAATTGARITEIPVRHHPRRTGASKYGMSRVGKVLADLIVLRAMRSFRNRPLTLFASGGTASFILGAVFAGLALRAAGASDPEAARSVVLPGIAALFAGLAVYLLMLGLMAEIISERWARTTASPKGVDR
jgi:hypothetical protein